MVVNAAAYTGVEQAEQDPEAALRVNRDGVANLARACADCGILLIHVSTDAVFDGRNSRPYREEDETNPLSEYARSKLAGEVEIHNSEASAIIVRTSWPFSPYRHNSVRSILSRATEGKPLRVVCDQSGSPTYAADLAGVVARLSESGSEQSGG